MNARKGERILDYKRYLILSGQTVVLGLSGGPDSVCLLNLLLAEHDGQIVCAHINHGLRGAESDEDESFVSRMCGVLEVPLEIKKIDAAAYASEKGMTVEEAGRAARYAFFDEVCERYISKGAPPPVIALAHNKDDQTETVLMRILRGTGTDGLAGIPEQRKSAAGFSIVRPLLDVPKTVIEQYLTAIGAASRTDSSNLGTEYLRNMLRLDVIPYIEKATDVELSQSLGRLSANAAEDKDFFNSLVTELLEQNTSRSDGDTPETTLTLPAQLLVGAHPAIRHRLIRQAFLRIGLDRDIAAVHLAAADRLLDTWSRGGEASGKRVEFPQDHTFGIRGKNVIFRAPGESEPHWNPKRKK